MNFWPNEKRLKRDSECYKVNKICVYLSVNKESLFNVTVI